MGGLTRDLPKPLLPIGSGTLIDHALDLAVAASVSNAVVNLHYRGPQIREHLAGRTWPEIAFSEEMPDILDTGGAISNALSLLGHDPIYVLNSDNVFLGPNPLQELATAWDPGAMDALLLLVPVPATRAYTRAGDFYLTEAGLPEPRGEAPEAPYVFTGAQILTPKALENAPKGAFSIKVIWEELRAKGRLRAMRYGGTWIDVGTPDGLKMARSALTPDQS